MIKIYGDSHAGVFKKFSIKNYKIDCENIPGATISGLPKRESTLNIKNKIIDFLKKEKPDFIVFKFGQVDIDLGYYYKTVVKKIKISKDNYITELVQNYQNFINDIKKYIDKKKIIIFGINPPALIDRKKCFFYTKRIIFNKKKALNRQLLKKIEPIRERVKFSKKLNNELRKLCNINEIKYVEVFDEFLNNKGFTSIYYSRNNDHHLKGLENKNTYFEPTIKLFKNALQKTIHDIL